MQSTTGPGTTGGTGTLPRVADLYDPTRTFEVRSRDVVYRQDGTTDWLARVNDPHAPYLHAKGLGRAEMLENHHRYFGDEATMREANPQLILERGEDVELPPALLFQGANDDVLAPRAAERFAEAYAKAGGLM